MRAYDVVLVQRLLLRDAPITALVNAGSVGVPVAGAGTQAQNAFGCRAGPWEALRSFKNVLRLMGPL